ncbi:hypothetical protein [uncultured Desulfuromonas sp.]|uniref:hypothetical protein n=1 Tax=uncultured Desulfuromonas sp. TaxID=181013 RepID=UPI002AAC396C|nr:hypothetical protein [uncultured Desulfuromonas sp.]
MQKKQKPEAMCTFCKKPFGGIDYINHRCGKCEKGSIRSMLRPDDWTECNSCGGTGTSNKKKCLTCDGWGWLNIRNKKISGDKV